MNTRAPHDSVVVERSFNVPPQQLFAAWTDPLFLARWISPNPSHQVQVEGVAEPGGAYAIRMGPSYTVRGTWLTLRPQELIELDWSWDHEDLPASHIRVELIAESGGTRLVLTHSRLADAEEAAGHGEGWQLNLARLADVLSGTAGRW
ncbi:SRPBCC family protein [Pseudactinotalea sp. Z1732]|uniref:SRPBCC family protein n=1 Tax=Micrococcales TaxID=85006 RepID=UPI003C7AE920